MSTHAWNRQVGKYVMLSSLVILSACCSCGRKTVTVKAPNKDIEKILDAEPVKDVEVNKAFHSLYKTITKKGETVEEYEEEKWERSGDENWDQSDWESTLGSDWYWCNA